MSPRQPELGNCSSIIHGRYESSTCIRRSWIQSGQLTCFWLNIPLRHELCTSSGSSKALKVLFTPSWRTERYRSWRARAWVRKLPRPYQCRRKRRSRSLSSIPFAYMIALALILYLTRHTAIGRRHGWRLGHKHCCETENAEFSQAPFHITRTSTRSQGGQLKFQCEQAQCEVQTSACARPGPKSGLRAPHVARRSWLPRLCMLWASSKGVRVSTSPGGVEERRLGEYYGLRIILQSLPGGSGSACPTTRS